MQADPTQDDDSLLFEIAQGGGGYKGSQQIAARLHHLSM